jgi:hypothetical protein
MNHRIYIMVAACVMGGGAMVALNACGDDDAPIAPGGEDGGGSSGSTSSGATSSSGTSGTSGGTSGSTSSGGTDGGDDGGGSSGVSNPGKITCGASECTVGTQLCCRGVNDAGCIADNDNCQGTEVECDEKADCPDQDDQCCLDFGGGGLRARCQGNCQARFRICKTAAECGDAGGCVEKTCGLGANAVKIRTCGPVVPGSGCQ